MNSQHEPVTNVAPPNEQDGGAARPPASPLESSGPLQAVFETMLDAVLVADDSANYLDANPAACRLLGYTRDELLKLSIFDLAGGAAPEAIDHAWSSFLGAGQSGGEFALTCKDGSQVEVDFRAVANVLPGMHVSVLRDVTARRRREKTIFSQNELLEKVLDSVPVMANLFDADGKLVWANREWQRVLGWSLEEACKAETLFEIYPDLDDRQRVMGLTREANTEWGDFNTRVRNGQTIKTSWSTVRLFDDTIIAIGHDITERKRTEESLRHNEKRFRALTENSWEGVTLFSPQGEILYVSPSTLRLLGYEDTQLTGFHFFEFLHEEDVPTVRSHFEESLKQEGQGIPLQYRLRHSNGSWLWLEGLFTNLLHEPALGAVVNNFRDITERRAAEAELSAGRAALQSAYDDLERRVEERTAELAAANLALKVEIVERQMTHNTLRETVLELQKAREEAERASHAKDEFLSRMSHELRTPLHAILGFGQLLAKSELNSDDRESVEFILAGGNHLLGLVNEVLDIARIEAGRLSLSVEPVAVTPLLREAIEMVRPLAAPRNIELIATVDDEAEWYARADHQRLRQVLLNLLSNAIKFNRDAGQVTLAASCKNGNNRCLRIEVRDTGIGLSPEELQKIFTPFERLKAAELGIEGSGIGLALSQKLVEAMGGRIGIESEPGVGSTFWLELLLTDSDVKAAADQALAAGTAFADETGAQNVKTILYIEDNPLNLKLLEARFARSPGIELLTATRGSLGLDMARENPPDLILLDLHLPDLNGDDVLKILKADPVTAPVPVIILSADAMQARIDSLKEAGAAAYLTKPLDLAELGTVVDDILKMQGG